MNPGLLQLGANHIRVDMACPPRKKIKTESPLYNTKRTIFVGNLPFDVKVIIFLGIIGAYDFEISSRFFKFCFELQDEEVYQLFCEDGEFGRDVEAVRVVRDPSTSLGKGIAYILLKSRVCTVLHVLFSLLHQMQITA